MDEDRESIDWSGVIAQFVVGVIAGGGAGFLGYLSGGGSLWLWITIPALLAGILAAMFGDRFWVNFVKFLSGM
ncbi:MAG: hypothetical protein ACM359_14195 [Bacillota bacterium]